MRKPPSAIEARSDIGEIERIAGFIEHWCKANGVSAARCHDLQLVAEELAMNSITHGYVDRDDGRLMLALSLSRDELSLVYADEAPPFDPLTEVPAPDLTSPLEERELGGLGVHFVKTLASSIGYRRDGGRNVLTATFQA